MGPIGSKVIEVKGQICLFLFVPPRYLGRSSPNLVERLRAAPDIIEVKGQIYVVFFFFSVCSSQVLGPIFTKLVRKVEGGPGY